ncbi:hypothetical protein [Spirosoma telluris]
MSRLRRTRIGDFRVEDAHTIEGFIETCRVVSQ